VLVAIDTASPVPVYEQLRSQLQRLIGSGQLPVGTRLPTIRQLAADLGIATATVSRVYELLANDGWVVGAGRGGTVVHNKPSSRDLDAELEQTVAHVALLTSQLGLARDDVVGLLDRALGNARQA
jgi:DNA-binding transcriptional regulator YhcF (GntR family)